MIAHRIVRGSSHCYCLGLFAAAVAGFLDLAPAKAVDLPPIVFVSRKLAAEAAPGGRATAIERALSGSLLVREVNGSIRALVDSVANPGAGLPVDVMNPDVSYDGARIAFAGYSSAEEGFRIYEVNAATGGELRQITHTGPELDLSRYGEAADLLKGHDDLDPCYLPDGRICFVSTRYPGVAPDARLRATNLYVVNADGTDLHRITTERFGADTPAVDPRTGQIVYSRWWRSTRSSVDPSAKPTDPVPPGSPGYGDAGVVLTEVPLRGIEPANFPGVNSWFLASIDPDGTDLAMFTGFRLDRNQTQAYRPSFLPGGDVLALFLPRTPFIGRPRGDGLRLYRKGPSLPTGLGGPQEFERDGFITQGDVIQPFPPATEPIYAGASGLPDGRLLVSAALPDAERDYGLYLEAQGGGPLSILYNRAGSAEMDAVAVLARPLPPRIPDHAVDRMADVAPRTVAEAFERGGSFTFSSENILFNAPVGVAIVNAPPAGKKLFIEFYAAPQLTSRTTADPPLLIERKEVPEDGKIEATLPAGVPLFEVLRRPDGTLAQGRDGQIFHVGGMNFGRAGETNRCVGCHMGHSQMAVPDDATWTNLAPSAFVIASSQLSNMVDATNPAIASPIFGGSLPFRAANVVDRKLDPGAGEWASQPQDEGEVSVALHWSTNLLAREVVVYGSASSKALIFGKDHDQQVQALTIRALRAGVVQQEVLVRQVIRPEGTRVPWDSGNEFDSMEVRIQPQDVVGGYEIDHSIALAEVEVIARAVGGPRTQFLRGDTDCNQVVELTDVIIILSNQYLGVPAVLCCGEAADVNDDDVLDISDPISLLAFLFINGPPPSAPFPLCGIPAKSKGDCAVDTCF